MKDLSKGVTQVKKILVNKTKISLLEIMRIANASFEEANLIASILTEQGYISGPNGHTRDVLKTHDANNQSDLQKS